MSGFLEAFLRSAREQPEDDTPRLVLADFLEEHGDPDRAEFIRLQCRLCPGTPSLEGPKRRQMEDRCERLLDRRGGCWLGPLWRWSVSPMSWHRGFLSVQLPRRCDFADLEDVGGWIDTVLFVLHGRREGERVLDWIGRSGVNHVHFDVRAQASEAPLLGLLARLPESACLRSLSVHWPLSLLRRPDGEGERPLSLAAVSEGFLATLLGELPLGRHITHLGTSRPFGVGQTQVIRRFGVEPVHARDRLWMHRLPPAVFQASDVAPSSTCPVLR